ncbi:MAG: hypothetical protein methR_P1692 [Methyloprofundus sp.]|nr:MAG: hypothetical protein methR_P1692 [Methyloprofundus sp.]
MNNKPSSSGGVGVQRTFLQLTAMAFLLGASQAASSSMIDSFSTSQLQLLDADPASSSVVSGSIGNNDTTIFGGSRDTSINLLSGPTVAKLDVIAPPGYLAISIDALSSGTGVIQWDGADNSINLDYTGLQSADLTENGSFDAFTLNTVFADQSFEFVIGVYTDATHWTEITYSASATNVAISGNFEFADFTNIANCGSGTITSSNISATIVSVECAPGSQPADFTNVGAIQLIIDPNGATSELDWVIDSLDRTLVHPQVCTASIGNVVWHDLNRDGIQDAGEPGINGVTVDLKNTSGIVIASTTTALVNGTSGYYEFPDLCADDYVVEVDETTLPPDFIASPVDQGSDAAVDSNGNPALVTLPNDNDSDLTIDFGYNSPCTGSIGNYVWFDENRNGLQDANEAGIAGVTVELMDAAGTVIATSITDASGFYEFTGLCAAAYSVHVNTASLPPEYVASPTLEGTDPTVDSDINGVTVILDTDTSVDQTLDFAYNSPCTGKIGNYVWFDENRNGIQDPGEAGIEGVTVTLKTPQNIAIATMVTDVNGYYEFAGLCADDYRVEVDTATLPAEYVPSLTLEGTDDTVDSNDNDSTVTLTTDNTEDLTIDFGYNSPCTGTIGNYIWFDENRNGLQDANEVGIAGVVVNLKDAQNTILATVTTDANGYYEFAGLCADDYKVEVDTSTVPVDYVTSPTLEGTDTSNDSNDNGSIVTLTTDTTEDLTIDFGYNSPCIGKIGNYIWFDENRNGLQDANEAGIAGVVVNLKDDQGTILATVTTDADGYYEFAGLCSGSYVVATDTSTLPPEYVASLTEEGADPAVDSNVNNSTVVLDTDTTEDMTIDFGYNSPCTGKIGNYIWFDANRNGLQDPGETGITGVVVNLKDAQNTIIATATTDASGYYEFVGLCADDYKVEVDTSTVPVDYIASPTLEGSDTTTDSNDNGSIVTLTTDTTEDLTIDFGYNSPCTGSIGNYIWLDANRNGLQDAGEAGIAGVVVNLKDSQNTIIATVTTDANGYYEFAGLCADDYKVEVDTSTVPVDYDASPTLEGTDTSNDSNDNGSIVTLTTDTTEDVTVDFGYNSPCTGKIGNYIWFDENRNGIQDPSEAGIAGVVVNLKDNQGTILATVTTDASGYYEFAGLCAASYIVATDTSTLPPEYVASLTEEGNDPTVDSNVNNSTVILDTDTTEDMTIDFGYNSPCTGKIGNYIWFDANRNGLQDPGETGITGVVVNLKDAQNTIIATATTDASGYYEFVGLCADDYKVEVDTSTVPVDYIASPTLEGTDTTTDSNDNGSIVTLTTDTIEDLTIDFGYNSPCTGSIGNYIWLDTNRNGLQDAGEAGIAGVIVNLKDSQNTIIATVTTDANGFYEFVGLCAADYKVEVDTSTVPVDYVASPTEEGTDPTIDSNSNGTTVTLTTDNGVDNTIDFAYNSPCTGSIGNYIWFDANRNGLQDASEAGIVGITVNLKDSQGTILATAITDANGYYEFAGLCANDYIIAVDTSILPPEYVTSPTEEGTDTTVDSNINDSVVTLTTDDSEDTTVDFAYNSPCTGNIGNYIWLDTNHDGIQDFNELGIAGVTVTLKDDQNTVIATTVTDANGFYEFVGFCAGDYTVEVDPNTLPTGVIPTTSTVGFDGEIDSNGSPAGVTLSGDFDSDITIDFGYIEEMIPGDNCQVCDGKVTQLTLQYNGSQPVQVVVEQKKGGEVFNATVQPGGRFTFTGTDKKGTLSTQIRIFVDGVEHTSLHTSCSVEIGPGTIAGDFEVIEAYSRNGGLMCPVDPVTPPGGDDCSTCDGKVTQLTMQYNGTTAAEITVNEKGKKGKVGTEVFNAIVQPGDHFTFSGTDKKGTLGTEISITVDGSLNTKMHTSCSVEIGPGTIAGDFEVIEAYSRNGGLMCPVDPSTPPPSDLLTCRDIKPLTELSMIWNGANGTTITTAAGQVFADVQTGNQITFTVNRDLYGNDYAVTLSGATTGSSEFHLSCSDDAMESPADCGSAQGNNKNNEAGLVNDFAFDGMSGTSGSFACNLPNTGVVAPSTGGGTNPPPVGDCQVCDGKVTQLTMQYNGATAAMIVVSQKKEGEVFNRLVQSGEHFTFLGTDKKGTLGTEISITVDGSLNTKIHTSCSVEIGPSTIAGDFEVIEAYSRNGGLMCSI